MPDIIGLIKQKLINTVFDRKHKETEDIDFHKNQISILGNPLIQSESITLMHLRAEKLFTRIAVSFAICITSL